MLASLHRTNQRSREVSTSCTSGMRQQLHIRHHADPAIQLEKRNVAVPFPVKTWPLTGHSRQHPRPHVRLQALFSPQPARIRAVLKFVRPVIHRAKYRNTIPEYSVSPDEMACNSRFLLVCHNFGLAHFLGAGEMMFSFSRAVE